VTVRNVVLVTHRWLGLVSALVLAIVGATGVVILYGSDIEAIGLLRRVSGRLHERLMLGRVGGWIVIITTAASVLLELGGLILWWKKKTVLVRRSNTWLRTWIDLHHAFGIVFLPLMVVIAISGVVMAFVTPNDNAELRALAVKFHMGRFPFGLHVLWAVASFGFLLQGLSGAVMWWKVRR